MTTTHKKTDGRMRLVQGDRYDVDDLICVGWCMGRGAKDTPIYCDDDAEGYHWYDYFRDGTYLGPDMYGVEPLFRRT